MSSRLALMDIAHALRDLAKELREQMRLHTAGSIEHEHYRVQIKALEERADELAKMAMNTTKAVW